MTTEEDDPHPDDNVPRASYCTIDVCNHGTLFVTLYNEAHQAIACAPFAVSDGANEFIADLAVKVAEFERSHARVN